MGKKRGLEEGEERVAVYGKGEQMGERKVGERSYEEEGSRMGGLRGRERKGYQGLEDMS